MTESDDMINGLRAVKDSVPCPACGGSGAFHIALIGQYVTCRMCGGSGAVNKRITEIGRRQPKPH